MWLCSILEFQFSKSQLVEYGCRYGLVKSQLWRLKTMDAIQYMLEKLWNFEKDPEILLGEELVTKSNRSQPQILTFQPSLLLEGKDFL